MPILVSLFRNCCSALLFSNLSILSYLLFHFSYAINDEYRQKLRDTIPYLGEWLKSNNFDVQKYTTTALFKLSFNRDNSLLIYQKGAVKVFITS